MYDYLRLELTGYVPPPPASVAAYAGNNCNLVCWPVTPGRDQLQYSALDHFRQRLCFHHQRRHRPGLRQRLEQCDLSRHQRGQRHDLLLRRAIGQSRRQRAPIRRQVPAPLLPARFTARPRRAHRPRCQRGASQRHAQLERVAPAQIFTPSIAPPLVDNGGGASNILSTIVLNNNTTATLHRHRRPTAAFTVTSSPPRARAARAPIPLPPPPCRCPRRPPARRASLTATTGSSNSRRR